MSTQLVLTYNNKPTTTSLLVAERFGKRHDDVLRAIRALDCSEEFRARNFTDSSYNSLQNKRLLMYYMTKDGFTLLVMSFTGSTAAKFKEEYIEQFNLMESLLRGQAPTLLPTYSERILLEPTKGVPKGFWSVFDKSHKIMLIVEKYVGSVNKYDLVDGSIGSLWSSYRKCRPWAVDCQEYPHEYKDVRGTRPCKCYRWSELEFFEEWLEATYRRLYLTKYLLNKYKNEGKVEMLERVEKNLQKLLK